MIAVEITRYVAGTLIAYKGGTRLIVDGSVPIGEIETLIMGHKILCILFDTLRRCAKLTTDGVQHSVDDY